MSAAGQRLINSMRQAADIMAGKADPSTYRVTSYGDEPNAQAIRLRLGLSQAAFAKEFGFSLDTLQKWEQQTRKPSGAAKLLLSMIETSPDAVRALLAGKQVTVKVKRGPATITTKVAQAPKGHYTYTTQGQVIAASKNTTSGQASKVLHKPAMRAARKTARVA